MIPKSPLSQAVKRVPAVVERFFALVETLYHGALVQNRFVGSLAVVGRN